MKHGKEGRSALCLSPDGLEIQEQHMLLPASKLRLPSPRRPRAWLCHGHGHGNWEKLPHTLLLRPSRDFSGQSSTVFCSSLNGK